MADFDVATTILLFLEKICYNDLFGFSPSFICFHPLFAWKTNVSIVAPFTFKRNNELAMYIYIQLKFTRVERNETGESRRTLKLREAWVLITRFVVKLSTTILQLIPSCIQVDDLLK